MNNHVQQRFDRSIREAVKETRQQRAGRPPRLEDPSVAAVLEQEQRQVTRAGRRRGWGLSRDPITGATVYGPLPRPGSGQ